MIINYQTDYQEEVKYKHLMLDFLDEYEDCFERSCLPGHFTGSAWLLNKDGSRVLLMHHTKLGIWVQLGGHCDGNSDVISVALKEAQEESGIDEIKIVSSDIFDLDVHLIPKSTGIPSHYHYDVRFLLQVESSDEFKSNRESKSLKWFGTNKSELPTNELSVTRMFDKWLQLGN